MVLGPNRDVITKKFFLEKFFFISPYLIPKFGEKILTRSEVIQEKRFLVLGPNCDVKIIKYNNILFQITIEKVSLTIDYP